LRSKRWRLDHHATGLSYVLAARLLPAVIFTLAGGVLVDRVPRRLVMLASDVARGAAVAVVTVLVATGEINLIGLVCMALVFGLGDAMFFPAAMAITPELVPSHLLVGASALNGTSLQLAGGLLGPAIGGLLVGFLGTAWGLGIDAASFIVSTAAIAAMKARSAPVASGKSPLADLREGLHFCFSQPWLRATTLGSSLGNLVAFAPLGAMIPLLVKDVLHGGGLALGLVFAAGGLGGLVATVLAGRREPPRRRLVHLWTGWGLSGVGVLGLGLVPDLWLAGGVAFVTYGLDAYGSVMFNPLIQEGVPDALLGRVSSVDYLFGFALSPLGLVAAGAATDAIGVRPTLIAGGAIAALTTLIPLLPGVEDPTLCSAGNRNPVDISDVPEI
jgi:MFS family permease